MSNKKLYKNILFIFILLLLVTICCWLSFLKSKNQTKQFLYFWDNSAKKLAILENKEFLETTLVVKNFEQRADLDDDLITEDYRLMNKQLLITEGNKILWQSPDDWQVDSFFLADADNDGLVDINLSVWKAGSFGTSQPFWVKENDMSIKNHFFVFNLVDDQIKALWQSSNLEKPNCEFILADIDDDKKNDLVVIEGEYGKNSSCEGKYLAIWKWNDWGFSNHWRSSEGKFVNLQVEEHNNQNYITINSASF